MVRLHDWRSGVGLSFGQNVRVSGHNRVDVRGKALEGVRSLVRKDDYGICLAIGRVAVLQLVRIVVDRLCDRAGRDVAKKGRIHCAGKRLKSCAHKCHRLAGNDLRCVGGDLCGVHAVQVGRHVLHGREVRNHAVVEVGDTVVKLVVSRCRDGEPHGLELVHRGDVALDGRRKVGGVDVVSRRYQGCGACSVSGALLVDCAGKPGAILDVPVEVGNCKDVNLDLLRKCGGRGAEKYRQGGEEAGDSA